MLVRNNTTCPSCGIICESRLSVIGKAMVSSQYIVVEADLLGCDYRRKGLFYIDDFFERLVKGHFWSLTQGKGISPIWAFAQMRKYSHRYKCQLINQIIKRYELDAPIWASEYDGGANPWFYDIVVEVIGQPSNFISVIKKLSRAREKLIEQV
jgi:hypothetical protein